MFPLDSKEPYIKENGSRSTLGEMFGDAGADVAEVKAALDDEIKTRAALGAHNLFKFPTLASIKTLNTTGSWEDNVYTINGVTYTVDEAAGTVTINGTAPSNDDPTLVLDRGNLSKYSGYDLSGYQLAETNGYMQIEEVGGSWTRYVRQSNGQKATIATIPSSTSYMFIRTQRGKTITNSVVSPMMTLTTDADDTFTPYAATNQELTKMLTVEDLTSQVTLAENCFSCLLLRQGNICHVNVAAKAGVSGFTSLATVPAILKPKYNTAMACFAVAGADSSKIADAVLNTDGLISIRTTSATSDITYLSCTWIV